MNTPRRPATRGHRRRRKWARKDIRISDPAEMRRPIAGTAVGNFMEWYDFGIYGYIATDLAQVFFPRDGAGEGGLIATFATLAAAFAVRPFGGFIFGLVGDRIGRRPVLIMTIVLMTLGTTATGVLPGYHSIGVWAPVLLVVTRVLQGVSTGGEYVGTMIYVGEHAADTKRGMMASFLPLSSQGGFVVAGTLVTGLQAWLTNDQMLSWGWRIPLLLSVPFGLFALTMRLRLEESPAYQQASGGEDSSSGTGGQQLRRTILQQWKPLLICIALVLAYNVTDYLLTGYLPTYMKAVVRIGHTAGMAMIVMTLLVVMAAVVFVARLSDRIGVKPVLWTGCGLLLTLSIPAFLLMGSGGSYPVIFVGVLLIGVMLLCFDATMPATLPALFPTTVRYGALAVGFNISVSTFGGSTALIAQALVSGIGKTAPAYMLVVAGLIGAAGLWFMPEVAGKRLPGSGPAAENEEQARDLAKGLPAR